MGEMSELIFVRDQGPNHWRVATGPSHSKGQLAKKSSRAKHADIPSGGLHK